MEDYINDQKCNDKNCSSEDVTRSTNKFGNVDNVDCVTCVGTPPDDKSEQQTDINPEGVKIISKKSQSVGSLHIENITNECSSQTPQGAIVVSNKVPQPVSKFATPPSGQTSLLNMIGQNEPKGFQLQLTRNDGEDNIPSDNVSNESYLPQTDGTYNYDDAMYEKNSTVDPNKCNQPIGGKNCAVDAVDPNNYVTEKNYNAPENEQIHVTNGAMNTNHILHNMGSDVDSEVEFEITHEDPEDQEIKLLVF